MGPEKPVSYYLKMGPLNRRVALISVVGLLTVLGLWMAMRTQQANGHGPPVPVQPAGSTVHVDSPVKVVRAPSVAGVPQPRVDVGTAKLSVSVVDPTGTPVEKAIVLGSGPLEDGQSPEFNVDALPAADNDGIYAGLAPGRWGLSVVAPLHFSRESVIELKGGVHEQVQVVLKPGLIVEGTLTNGIGAAHGPSWIWFLPPGAKHPILPSKAEELIQADVGRDGGFQSPLLVPGAYRLSTGPVGRCELFDDQPRSLEGGKRHWVRGVIGGFSQLDVEVLGLPPGLRARVVLLAPKDSSSRELEASSESEEKADPKKQRWRHRADRELQEGTQVRFLRIPHGEYRLGVSWKDEWFLAETRVHIERGVYYLANITIPKERGGVKGAPVPLTVRMSEVPPDLSLGSAGFHW